MSLRAHHIPQRLSTVPTVDWVLPACGKSNKGQDSGSLQLQVVCMRTLPLAGTVCPKIHNVGCKLLCGCRAAHGTVGADDSLQAHSDAQSVAGTIILASGDAKLSSATTDKEAMVTVPT